MMRGFSHIDTWVFDLDNTLYPASCRLFDQIDVKITASGYQTVTLTRSATELARKPQLSIGLPPAPKQ